ncbi:MAG: SxtJ family membrane protein [Candidatus Omnitrophota bacterium]
MDKEKKNLLVFGYGLGLIALVLGTGGVMRHGVSVFQIIKLACGVFFIIVTALKWQAFRPAYKGWMAVAHVIGGVVTGVLLTVVYFVVFTPTALFLKLMGKDHLERRRDQGRATFWHARDNRQADKERFRQQY